MATTTEAPSGTKPSVTDQDTSAVYDRQIRLWGADAQSKLSSATVLYIHITGVSSEILKNLVLAGVQPAICDGRPYPDTIINTPTSLLPHSERHPTEPSSTSSPSKKQKQTVADAIKPQVLDLNPFLSNLPTEDRPLSALPDTYFGQFDVVVASQLPPDQISRISSATTKNGGQFFLVDTFGTRGVAVLDLGKDHTFRREVGRDKLTPAQKATAYAPASDIMNVSLGDCTGRWDKVAPLEWAAYRTILAFVETKKQWPREDVPAFRKFAREYLVENSNGGAALPFDYLGGDDALEALANMYEYAPVCAVLGGVIGNEIIKALSGKGEPANNVLLFDGEDGGCRSFLVKKKET
eukprot:CAMPEP_0172500866 /NCGR_PEP_ID=MMETSP1066-20121228/143956_1 /TAXON_ID=671091 /ORGANISM="Coscinodiscus wailesii, Strain CCMP2513" /LENGTH=351 /DNA_ID=CAMNT_0013275347 /DNA_START=41 /DNA_END=1096 /DNA_ORIENTATION=-